MKKKSLNDLFIF